MDNLPPNDPNAPQGYEPQEDAEDVTLNTRGPALGGGSGKVILFAVIMVGFLVFMLDSIFSDSSSPSKVDPLAGVNKSGDASRVAGGDDLPVPPVSAPLPPPPSTSLMPPPAPGSFSPAPGSTELLTTPPPLPPLDTELTNAEGTDIPPPPLAPPVPDANLFTPGKVPESNEKAQARIRSNMLIMDGQKGAGADGAPDAAEQSLNQSDPNRAFASNVLRASPAQKSIATRLNNLSITIAQGKIINAVLETAINTDLPGTLRAIVSRDTYAETGRDVLIPKGARLIGTYNTGVLRGQKRVMIIWTRLIRPDGMDIQIGSAAVDNLGRAGIAGFVDNKYMEIFSAAILTTSLSIGAAVGVDKLINEDSSTTSNTDGSTTTNASPGAIAAANAVNDLSAISKDVVSKLIDLRPTITIDQGTRINVFVNRDLTFPSALEDAPFVQ